MGRALAFALCLVGAGAFVAPSARTAPLTVHNGALDGMVGAGEETGGVPWDPLGFSKIHDLVKDSEHANNWPHVKFLREAEIKHGRIAMLAFVGVCVQKGLNFHWPGVDANGFYFDASAPW